MRQFTPPTNLVLAVVLAGLVVVALGLPWYGAPAAADPASFDGPVERGAGTVARWFSSSGTPVNGTDALDTAELLLLGLAGATAGLALLMSLQPLRDLLRSALKLVPLVAPFVVVVQLFSPPAGLEIRYGVFVALAVTLFMANSAFHGAELRTGASSARPRHPAGGPAGPPGAR